MRAAKLILSAVLLFGMTVFAFFDASKTLAAADARTVRVGIYDNKPKVFLDQGKPAGLFPDILDYIAVKEKWRIDYVFGTWEEGLARLEKGEIDIMVDAAVSEARREQFDFTNETVFSSWGMVFVRRGSPINSFQGLEGKKIAVLESSVYLGGPSGIDTYVRAFGLKADLVKVAKQSDVFDLLADGKVDAGVVSRVFALGNQKTYPNIKATDIFFSPTELRFALTKGSADNPYLAERLDYWVSKLRDGHEGVYQKILERYDLAGFVVGKEVIPRWVKTAGLVGAIILLLSWLVVVWLKQAGLIRTRKLEAEIRKGTEKLEDARAKTEAMLLSIGEGLFVVDMEGKIILVNEVFEELLGWRSEEALGKKFVDLVPAEDGRGNRILPDERPISVAMAKGRGTFSPGSDYYLVRKNKTKFPTAHKVSLVTQKGKTIGAVGVFSDITKEKGLERAKDEFLSLVSHQLRTPLAATRWTLELFSEEKKLTPKNRERIADLDASNQRLINLVDDLLKVTKLEAGKWPVNKKIVDLAQLINDSRKLLKPVADKKTQEIVVSFKTETKGAEIDPVLIGEVVNNMLDNAITYGKVNSSIDITVSTKNGNFVVAIHNLGSVIRESDREKVFKKFERGVDAQSLKTGGTGLGLYFSKKAVEMNGGTIWFESSAEKGTTFYFTVPKK